MSLNVDIIKTIGEFSLNVRIQSDKKRIGILGASGSGKSMTLRCIAGIDVPVSGHIDIGGCTLYDSAANINLKPQKRNVGYMFQNYALFPTMTVLQNVCCGLKGKSEENGEKAAAMLNRMKLNGYEQRLPGELSGGQQQRVALARILVCQPRLILLDEPFSALDQYLRDRMQRETLELLNEYDGQVIMVSHSRDELFQFSEDLFVMREGSIMASGSPSDVFKNPGKIEVAKMTGCKNFSDVEVIDEYHVFALGWGIELEFNKKIPPSIKHVGYRAHEFVPVWGERKKNCIKCNVDYVDILPFENRYYIKPESDSRNPDDVLCWYVQTNSVKTDECERVPDYLQFAEDEIMLLE